MNTTTGDFVRCRAQARCEYCGIPQEFVAFKFQIEHIIAKQHGGPDDAANLALACERCNAYKGTNLSAIDPQTGNIVPLFHPRQDRWHSHFALEGAILVGRSDVGRATIRLLHMNAFHRVALRSEIGPVAAPSHDGEIPK
jgi:hypothetical protein